ncbi:serine hydrolase domain-containing protein [Bacillus sp. FJAT-47783]|uniref:serine hydrolase domain-containing protein n=1 Tax=Bacillus sp. FJAT-47783 TaxID=2922712 RepID=UPI001FAB65F8|nr:serine hydrolase domain-containing protein [Bacillus sp. FJAT-47783]
MTCEEKSLSSLDAILNEKCKSAHVPGMAIAVSQHGEIVFEKYFGYRDVERLLPVTSDTIFGVASITKSFTALAIMQLEDERKLSVNDPVVKWLPELRLTNQAFPENIKIHHLLTHTSGLPGMEAINRAKAESIRKDPDGAYLTDRLSLLTKDHPVKTVVELIEAMSDTEYSLLGQPGEVFNYSNEGYALLQEVIERASGQQYITYMRENILDPLGMYNSTFLINDLSNYNEVAELYSYKKGIGFNTFHSPTWWHSGEIYSHGALKSCISDLRKYLEVYRLEGLVNGERIVSKKSLQKMTTQQVMMPTGNWYGYGLHVDKHDDIKILGHGGSIKGVSSHMKVAKEQGITVVVLMNISKVGVKDLAETALNHTLGIPKSKNDDLIEYKLTSQQLNKFVGIYQSAEGIKLRFVVRNGILQLVDEEKSIPMKPYSEDSFFTPGGNKIKFLFNIHHEITGVFKGVRFIPRSS